MELRSPTEFAKQKVLAVQEYVFLAAQSVGNLFRKPLYFADMVQQADLIGVGSLPIVVLTGFFTGGVLALHVLLLCAAGRTPTEIATFLFCSRTSVYRIVNAYQYF